jgi:hypothetical protein
MRAFVIGVDPLLALAFRRMEAAPAGAEVPADACATAIAWNSLGVLYLQSNRLLPSIQAFEQALVALTQPARMSRRNDKDNHNVLSCSWFSFSAVDHSRFYETPLPPDAIGRFVMTTSSNNRHDMTHHRHRLQTGRYFVYDRPFHIVSPTTTTMTRDAGDESMDEVMTSIINPSNPTSSLPASSFTSTQSTAASRNTTASTTLSFVRTHVLFNLALAWLELGTASGCDAALRRSAQLYERILREWVVDQQHADADSHHHRCSFTVGDRMDIEGNDQSGQCCSCHYHYHDQVYSVLVCLVLNNLTYVYSEQCNTTESDSCRAILRTLLQLLLWNDQDDARMEELAGSHEQQADTRSSSSSSRLFALLHPDDLWGMLWNVSHGTSSTTALAA